MLAIFFYRPAVHQMILFDMIKKLFVKQNILFDVIKCT